MTLDEARTTAIQKGCKVAYDEKLECWYVITPKRFRVQAQTHYSYQTEGGAWFGAALLAKQF